VLNVAAVYFLRAYSWGVRNVDPADPLRFNPHSDQEYVSREYRFRINANRFGRRDAEWTEAQIADPSGIVVIGDSMVLGYGVEAPHTLPAQLAQELARRNNARMVFNFGMPGDVSLPQYQALLAKADSIGIAARTIVLCLTVGNDFSDKLMAIRSTHIPLAGVFSTSHEQSRNSLSFAQVVQRSFVSSSFGAGVMLKAVDLCARLGIPLRYSASTYIFKRTFTEEEHSRFYDVLGVLDSIIADARGRQLVVVIVPTKFQVENYAQLTSSVFDAQAPNARIAAYCRQRGIPCVDMLPALRTANRSARIYFPFDRHFTPEGNACAARVIADYLLSTPAVR
jgi:hypothetical protein